MNSLEITPLILFQMDSIGFKSGEYGGRKTRFNPISSAVSMVSFARWDLKLSRIITICLPGFNF